MELKTRVLDIFNRASYFSDKEPKIIKGNVIEKLSVDLKGYPQFSLDKLCLCSDKYCKEIDVEMNVTLNFDRNELFKLAGLIGTQDAVADVFESINEKINENEDIDKVGGALPIKMTFELDVDAMVEMSEKLKELNKQNQLLKELKHEGDQ